MEVVEDGITKSKTANTSEMSLEKDATMQASVLSSETVASGDEGSSTPPRKTVWLARWQMFAVCFSLFLSGWEGGTPGPLLPRLQTVYHVDFLIISLLFVFNCVGFISGALMNVYMTHRLGFGKTILLGSLGQTISYTILAAAPPFPAFCFAYVINAWGVGIQVSQANSFVAGIKENSAAKMGLLHAHYGLGAVFSPLAATKFAQIRHWSFLYLISLGIAVMNDISLLIIFRGKTQDQCLQEIGQEIVVETASDVKRANRYREIFSQKAVHILALFGVIYVGAEFTISGWSVTYVRDERNGGPSTGYVSTGFFGGIALGRVALLWVSKKVGEHRVVYLYIVFSFCLELIIWFVPSIVGDAIAVSLVGVMFGPIYPILMNESARLVPPRLLSGSISWIGGVGSTGSALFPFLTGALASHFGIRSLQPFLVSLLIVMTIIWYFVPRVGRITSSESSAPPPPTEFRTRRSRELEMAQVTTK